MNDIITTTDTINDFLQSIGRVVLAVLIIRPKMQTARMSPPMLCKCFLAWWLKKGGFCPTLPNSLAILIISLIIWVASITNITIVRAKK